MRGATRRRRGGRPYPLYFNPRSSCEERRQELEGAPLLGPFQSTLLMRGATQAGECGEVLFVEFQSTLLMRGATCPSSCGASDCQNFNPRSSCEERRGVISLKTADRIFQSTLLMRGATKNAEDSMQQAMISIHAPHARSDNYMLQIRSQSHISIHAPHARSDFTK